MNGNRNTPSRPVLTLTYSYSLRSLNDRWGIKDDWATTFLHSSLSSAFRRAPPNPNPVHYDILSFHLFFCLSLLLPPSTVPCRIFASPVDFGMCPHHLNLRFLAVVIRSSHSPIACPILSLTSSFLLAQESQKILIWISLIEHSERIT